MLAPASSSLHRTAPSPILHLAQSPSIPFGQYTTGGPDYSGEQPESAESLSRLTADKVPHLVRWLVLNVTFQSSSNDLRISFPPSRTMQLLAYIAPHELSRGSSRFYPPHCYQLSQAGTSSLLRSHLPPHTASFGLESPLGPPYLCHFRTRTMQGFPSYCGFPVSSPTLNHATDLTKYRASRYFARLPTHNAESGSLTLCAAHFLSLPSDPAVASNALAIQIVFPLVRATPASLSRPGLPTTLGKQKGRAISGPASAVS